MKILALAVALAFCTRVAAQACTVFFAFDGRVAIAGQNEDWDDSNTQMWTVPATDTTFGVLCCGFGRGDYPENGVTFSPRVRDVMRGRLDRLQEIAKADVYGLPQQGVNEKGLFFGGAQTDVVAPPTRPGRPMHDGAIVDLILRRCATAAEARQMLDAYQYVLPAGHVVVQKTGRHQVMTNFLRS